jgi:hypothetical protein
MPVRIFVLLLVTTCHQRQDKAFVRPRQGLNVMPPVKHNFYLSLKTRRTIVQGKDFAISFMPFLDVSQKYIPQSEEFTDNKNIVISRCTPNPSTT